MEINTASLENSFDKFVKAKEMKYMRDIKTIAELIKEDIQENIMQSRKVPSGKMAKNTKATIALKHGYSSTPMVNTGQLYHSVSTKPITNGYEIYLNGDRNNDVAYWNSYDRKQDTIFGKKRRVPITIPARPFFGIRGKIKPDLKRILNG